MAGEILISTAAELAPTAAEPAYGWLKQQLSYVFKYQSYINDLKKQVEDLRKKRETVEKPVEEAKRQGKEIYEVVKDWLSDVEKFTEEVAKAIIEDEDKANKGGCFKLGSCPNLIQRYKRGKEAMKATKYGADLLGKGNYSEVSYRPAVQRTESMYVREYETFDSREQAFQEIMEALQDVNVNMIGVCGMGGVGKTTVVKKVAWEAKKNELFDKVVIAEATQTPDYKKIQEKVAYELGLVFGQEGEYQRTDLLRDKIKKQRNLLIILDDIWTKLDLDAIGIPFGGVGREKDEKIRLCTKVDSDAIGIPLGDVEREKDEKIRPCTILLISRDRYLLSKDMKTQRDIFIGPLSNGEAWNMFHKIVGDVAESSDFRSAADEIVKECNGLPVAISLIANALENRSLHVWEDVLAQLQRSNPTHILDTNETLYSMIELSYEFLKNEEAKSLFLLCALYKAGDSVFIDDLLKYSMGWNLFEDVYTLEEGRSRLHNLIDHLKASCLLKDGAYDNSVKMHGIVHAVAVSIAATEKLMFNIQNDTGLKDVLGGRISKDSTAISLPYRNINDDLLEWLEYPKLELFFLFCENRSPQIADAFFDKMKELKVLSACGLQFLPLPSSISFLKNLQTLSLKSCTFGDIRILGELSKLKFLSLVGSNIEELPVEIGQLTQLKLLDLSNCLNLKYIATNVISSLSQLEELYMGNSFVQWEVEGVDNQGQRNASLEELKQLSNLTALHLHIQDGRVMPQDLFFKKLKSFKIFIGDKWKWSIKFDLSTSRILKLKIDDSIHLGDGVKSLLKLTEDLFLEGTSGVRNVIYELGVDGFQHLKHLDVQDDPKILYIINSVAWKLVFPNLESLIIGNLTKLENICHGQLNAGSFRKLRIIKIEKCDKLEYLFALFIAKNLVQLQKIEVTDCENLKEIFGGGDEIETNNQTELNQLCSLTLQRLPKFIRINSDMRVVFPRLENLKVCSINFENTCIRQPLAMFHYSQCLKSLTVEDCNDLKFLFSSSMVKSLNQLQELLISNCKSMEVIIDLEGVQKEEKIVDMSFPKLLYMKLKVLPKLTSFVAGNLIEFPFLKGLHIEHCHNLKTFFCKSFYPETEGKVKEEVNSENDFINVNPLFDEKVAFPSLEEMVLLHLDNLQLIWQKQKLHVDSFCKLKVVRVEFCEKLLSIIPSNAQGHLTFHNLEILKVKNCWSIKSLFPVSTATGLVQLKELWINSCGLENIVSEDEVNGPPTFFFPQLTGIYLCNLPELKCFYPRFHTLEWPMLRSLGVYGCKKIKVYASELRSFEARDRERQHTLFLLEKVIPNLEELGLDAHDFRSTFLHYDLVESFGKLKILWLSYFDDDDLVASLFDFLQKLNCLESLGFTNSSFKELFPYEQGLIWKQNFLGNTYLQNLEVDGCHRLTILMSSATSFKSLKTLEVCNCDGLASVLTIEAAKTLVNLTTMRIRECKLLIEVIANKGDKEEEVVFGQLKVLELHCLSSLAFFCSANYSFKFPCLEQVIVSQCPKLNVFSQGVLSTLLLKKVQLIGPDDNVEFFWKEDLNSTIQQIFIDMIGFRNMKYVKLSEFPTLKEKIWNEGLPVGLFCNLKCLVLDEDFDKSTAFPFHVFNDLRNLETLEVRNYHSLEDLFDIKGKTVKNSKGEILGFNNLKSLKVHSCSGLRYIFTPAIILGLDQLQEIEVKNCALIEEIITKDEGKEGAIDKIFIPHLNSIVLELLPDLTNFYSGTNYLECPSLKSITIANCPKMETFVFCDLKTDHFDRIAPLFSEKVAFPSLEKMVLLHLDSLQLIWHNQTLHLESFCKLKVVRVESCKKLLAIVPSNTQRHLTFHNLEILEVKNCWSMKSLFPVSTATCLMQLKELKIWACGLEKIVSEEEVNGAPIFLFPQLNCIHLLNLLKLKCFYPRWHAVEWPMLKFLVVHGCKNINLYASEFPSFQAIDGERQPALFLLEKVIPNLEVLGLDAHDFELTFLHYEIVESFGKLKILLLAYFDDELVASLFDFLQKLNCLESLFFWDGSFKELFPYEQGHIWKQDFLGNTFLPNLQKLQVVRCHSLTILMPSTISFKNLETLEVYNCNGLAKVLTSETAKTLVNLTTMRIRECKLLIEVMANEGDKEEEIVFCQLKVLELHFLSSLAFFCSTNYSFKFPCLEQVIVSKCPKLNIFSQGALNTPLLKKVQLTEPDDDVKYFWKDDLNSTIQQMFANMGTVKKRKRDKSRDELRFPLEKHFKAQVTTRGYRDVGAVIKKLLTERQLQMFRRTCFGHFLDLKDSRFSGVLIHSFILRAVNKVTSGEELWFRVNDVDVRFSTYEFAIMIGLRFNHLVDMNLYIPSNATDRILHTYFHGCKSVTYADLGRVFQQRPWGEDDTDAVKLALLFYLHMGLLGSDMRKIISQKILQLADHLNVFNTYPWGVRVWQMTYRSICDNISRISMDSDLKKKKENQLKQYVIMGFPLAFQFWIYETLDSLFRWVDMSTYVGAARMLRWHTKDIPGWDSISVIFTGDPDNVNFPLDLSPIERDMEWYKDIVRYTEMSDSRSSSTLGDAPSSPRDVSSSIVAPPVDACVKPPHTCSISDPIEELISPGPGPRPLTTKHISPDPMPMPPTTEQISDDPPATGPDFSIHHFDAALARWGSLILARLTGLEVSIEDRFNRIDGRMTLIKDRLSRIEDTMTRTEAGHFYNHTDTVGQPSRDDGDRHSTGAFTFPSPPVIDDIGNDGSLHMRSYSLTPSVIISRFDVSTAAPITDPIVTSVSTFRGYYRC